MYEVDWTADDVAGAAIGELIDVLGRQGRLGARPSMESFRSRFEQLQTCDVPATVFTPAMCRLFYELGYASGAERLIGIGTYTGSAMSLLMAGVVDGRGLPASVRADGIDTGTQVASGATPACGTASRRFARCRLPCHM